MPDKEPASHFWVNGVVAQRDNQPYIQLSNENGILCQLTPAQARQIARDIETMTARTEADAMVLAFFDKQEFPQGAAMAIMVAFRDFRARLDDENVEHTHRG